VVGGRDKEAGDSYDNTPVVVQPTVISRTTDGMGVLAFDGLNQAAADVHHALRIGKDSGDCVVCTTGAVTHALTTQSGSTEDGTGRGTPIIADTVLPALPASLENSGTGHNKDELIIAQSSQWNADFDSEKAFTLNTMHDPQYLVQKPASAWPKEIADTLTVAYAKKWGLEDQQINSGAGLFQPTAAGRPRRLTPLECERLMSWPDQWTATGRKEDGTEYALSDTARYRLCGNGVGSVCVAWFAQRLAAML